ncbi:MAG: hypothetical protein HeimC2_43890 [Candidatus Heimdallarchaeota archaeon LC_2]|nr:MAG: hypothetical protein HeimC2_43890 [Candidatus Heimdallarchaeota archaeon LC_2]
MLLSDFLMDYVYDESIKEILRFYNAKLSGVKAVKIERLIKLDDFHVEELPDFLYREEIQDICDALELPRSGKKDDLWERILEEIEGLEYRKSKMRTSKKNELPIQIQSIAYQEVLSLSDTSLIIDIKIKNNTLNNEVVILSHYSAWSEGQERKEDPISISPGEIHNSSILLQTPKENRKYKFQVKLLNENNLQYKRQAYLFEFEIKKSRKDKILQVVSNVGEVIVKAI